MSAASCQRPPRYTSSSRSWGCSDSATPPTVQAAPDICTCEDRTRRGRPSLHTLADYRKPLGVDAYGELTGDGFLGFAGRLRMAEVEPQDVREYAAKLAARGLARNTVRLALAPVKAMFATALEDGVIRWNPAAVRVNVGAVVDDLDDEGPAAVRGVGDRGCGSCESRLIREEAALVPRL
jgi:hypothetical protein